MSTSSERNPLEELAEEFAELHRRGASPSINDYAAKHPEWADEIRELFPALAMIEQFKPSIESGEVFKREGQSTVQSFGDYRILREVGRGGMGVVYEAEQISLGRHVALKVLPSHRFLSDVQVQRFEREAKAAGRLHHTNIVPVYGVGEHEGTLYYVMQFIRGLGLDEVLKQVNQLRKSPAQDDGSDTGAMKRQTNRAKLSAEALSRCLLSGQFAVQQPQDETVTYRPPANEPSESTPSTDFAVSSVHLPGQTEPSSFTETGRKYWISVARIGMQVADALAHAHSQGTMHRDIKPSNLLLDEHGIVWITDFGLAKTVDEEDNLTDTGDVVGTMRYVAPERFKERGDVRSDIFSLGLTLYELLALRPAFDAADRSRLVEQVMNAEPPRLRKLNAAIPRDLETIVLKAISREPVQRYQTASELAADLRRFVEDKPIWAKRSHLLERVVKWTKRRPAVAGLISLVALVALLGISGIFWQWRVAVNTSNELADSLERESDSSAQAIASQKSAERLAGEAKKHAAQAMLEAQRSQRVSKFLAGLFVESDRTGFSSFLFRGAANPKPTPAALEILETGAKRIDLLDEEPEIKATLMDTLGVVYVSMGMLHEAEPLLTGALEIRRKSKNIQPSELAFSLRHVGLLRLCQGDHLAADEHLKAALRIPVENKLDHDTIQILLALGRFERSADGSELSELERSLRKVIDPAASTHEIDPRMIPVVKSFGALVTLRLGNFPQAEKLLMEAKGELSQIGFQDPAYQMCLATELGLWSYIKLGQQLVGLESLDYGVTKCQEVFGESHFFAQLFQMELGRLFHRLSYREPAETYYEKAVSAAEKPGDQRLREAMWRLTLADLQQEMGKTKEAADNYQKVTQIRTDILGDDHPDTVAAKSAPARPRIIMYHAHEFQWYSMELNASDKAWRQGNYFHDTSHIGSIKYCLPAGWKLQVFDREDFQGPSRQYEGTGQMEGVPILDRQARSIKIIAKYTG